MICQRCAKQRDGIHTCTLTYLYRFMRYTTELELALARSSPCINMANVAYLTDRLQYWEAELAMLEWRIN